MFNEDDETLPTRETQEDIEAAIAALARMQELDEDNTEPKAKSRKYKSTMVGYFHRVVCDEGHAVKTIKSRQHQSVALLLARHIWFLTATPMSNKPTDMLGYLTLLYKAEWDGQDDSDIAEDGWMAYQNAAKRWSAGEIDAPVYLLAPRRLAALAHNGQLDALTGFHVLPVILGLICLGRVYADPQPGTDIPIGSEIPPNRVMTIELAFSPRVQQDHDRMYAPLARILKQPGGSKDGDTDLVLDEEGRMHMGIFRWLCLAAISPRMHRFAQRIGNQRSLAAPMREEINRPPDLGFSLYFSKTCLEPNVTVPNTAVGQALYLAGDAPKLRYLLKIFDSEGLWDPPFTGIGPVHPPIRFIVFIRWPLTGWLVEMFLDALGIRYATIRSGQTQEERSSAKGYFCDPKSDCQVALASYATGSLGLNLHHCCARTVMMEAAPNVPTEEQVIGRTNRMGQRLTQKIWILFSQHTIERYISYNNSRKFIPQAAATLAESDIKHRLKTRILNRQAKKADGNPENDPEMAVSDEVNNDIVSEITSDTIEEMAAEAIMAKFGQATSRLLIDDIHNLGYD